MSILIWQRLHVAVSVEVFWTLLRSEDALWKKLNIVLGCLKQNLIYKAIMIQFVSHRNCFALKVLLGAFWMIVTFALLNLPLFSQEQIDYRGIWQTETPDNQKLILIVKRNQLASWFWADKADCTVYQGSWNSDADGITLKWEDGSTHRITRSLLEYRIVHYDASKNVLYEAAATRLPDEILGQWAKAPSSKEDQVSDRDKAESFFGTWKTGSEKTPCYLVVEPDRSAATSWTRESTKGGGLRGSWAKQGSELHIAWGTGHYGILKQNEDGFTFKLIAPGSTVEKDTSEEWLATRINEDSLPDEWQQLYASEKASQTQDATLKNRTDALSFYRGSWIVQRSKDTFERIEIGRFGGLKTSADETLHGNWRMSGQNIFMNWDNGMRKILRSVGNGFLIYEYKPGRPIDGVPTRIFPAAPENTNKLARYTAGQKAVATELLESATDAGVITDANDNGLGFALIRWAWPFDENNDETQRSNALLQTDPELPRKVDPLWWPFWSENPSAENVEKSDVERHTDEVVVDAKTLTKTRTIKPSKPDWDWPF
jgi:hypothetical protein